MLKAVLFDMDGVIVDTEPLHRKAYFKMFDEVNIEVDEALYDSFTGQATVPICRILCEKFQLSESPETLVAIKRKHFKYLFENDSSLTLLDGVHELIQDYYNNGLTLILASSASMANIDRIFNRFDLNKYFKAKISGAALKASKPHPEIFIKAAALAEQPAENCMVIEDSTNGIAAAKAAAIYCVGFKSPHSVNQDYTKADKVITNFGEIAFSKLEGL
ncbi:HAD family phosphatase [Aequorivita sp. Q41]|uniref:HAD family hydrolase n=1 Tax=Aequorivita sp. Q41 TaxID=3153300 RepID=UPI003241FCAE